MKQKTKGSLLVAIIGSALTIPGSSLGAITKGRMTTLQWHKLTSDKAFSYRNELETKKLATENEQNVLRKIISALIEFFGSPGGILLIWLLVIGIVGYFLYSALAGSNSFLFRRGRRVPDGANDESDREQDIAEVNWETLMNDALSKNDFRLAVRYSYMWLLQILQKGELIKYQTGKTNFDYAQELKETKYRQEFMMISRQYEYAWYGQTLVTGSAYENHMKVFNKIKAQLGA